MPHPLLEHYRAMARNNAWSNARLLEACTRLSDEAFAAPRVSFFPSLQMTLNHILLVDRYYLADMKGPRTKDPTEQNPVPPRNRPRRRPGRDRPRVGRLLRRLDRGRP